MKLYINNNIDSVKVNLKNKEIKTIKKESCTLDNKHRQMVTYISNEKSKLTNIMNKINIIDDELDNLDINIVSIDKIKNKRNLLNKKDNLKISCDNISNEEMDYYDTIGDLIINYYDNRNDKDSYIKESKSIIDFLNTDNNNIISINNNKNLLEKYCQRIEGIRINHDDGTNRIKYCIDCTIEKILDIGESAYICPCCGTSEMIILDEDRQIKDYSPYKRLNHFREWLNQFQAKQTPDIPDIVFINIIKELKKTRIIDLSILNKVNMKTLLKKLDYNIYYEHIAYIINKLNNLPPPKITRDMEKLFISMFYKIQDPWELHKQQNRKNFLSYSYVLHKFCELLDLTHLLDCFPLHKDSSKIVENDQIWRKICYCLRWEYISSFK